MRLRVRKSRWTMFQCLCSAHTLNSQVWSSEIWKRSPQSLNQRLSESTKSSVQEFNSIEKVSIQKHYEIISSEIRPQIAISVSDSMTQNTLSSVQHLPLLNSCDNLEYWIATHIKGVQKRFSENQSPEIRKLVARKWINKSHTKHFRMIVSRRKGWFRKWLVHEYVLKLGILTSLSSRRRCSIGLGLQ